MLNTKWIPVMTLLSSCGLPPVTVGSVNVTGTQPSVATTTDSTSSLVDTVDSGDSYPYSGRSSCWMDRLKTNGPSFGKTGNSRYQCVVSGSLHSPIEGTVVDVGFYRDGTLSYSRRDGTTHVYTAFANPDNCDMGFDNSDHSYRYVIFQQGTLNTTNELASIPSQLYFTNPPALTDTTSMTCSFYSR